MSDSLAQEYTFLSNLQSMTPEEVPVTRAENECDYRELRALESDAAGLTPNSTTRPFTMTWGKSPSLAKPQFPQ